MTGNGMPRRSLAATLAIARVRVASTLARWGGRPTLLAVAIFNVLTFILLVPTFAAGNFGLDSGLYRRCALVLLQGGPSCGSPYPPLMALASTPLALLSATGAAIAMTSLGLTILLVGVVLETRGHAWVDRVLVAIAAVTFLPVVYEVALGQTTLALAAAFYPVSRRPDSLRTGIPVGIAVALAPKVLLVPILGWMLVWRRRSLLAALLTAAALTSIGVVFLGIDSYRTWFDSVTAGGSSSLVGVLSSRDMGNLSLWPLDATTLTLAAIVVVVALWAILRDPSRGFVASVLAGLLLAPYSLLYAYCMVLLVVKPALAFAPRITRALALTLNIAHPPASSIAWTLVALAACVPVGRRRTDRAGDTSDSRLPTTAVPESGS